MRVNAVVVIPSFNSAPWIVDLINKIKKHKEVLRIIVVDDNSPDGTAQIVKDKFGHDNKVMLLKRTGKGGRGSAVIAGFKKALKEDRADAFIEMDSDFAHDPKDLPKLFRASRKYDLVIGSRYIKGGKTSSYKTTRRLFSFISNKWVEILLGLGIRDYTSGFRCYRREIIEGINLSDINSKGFIVLSEMAYKASRAGFSIGEVPITVIYHPSYKSNLNLKEIIDAFIGIIYIRFNLKP